MSERIPDQSNERISGQELAKELEQMAENQLEKFDHHAETEPNQTEKAEQAREALEKAAEPLAKAAEEAPREVAPPTRLDRLVAYRHTLKSLQGHLKPVSKSFSKFIHTPAVEKTSEVLEKTVMRPSVTLGASLTALVVGGVFYFTARSYGFRLSGSEFLVSLLVGGILGALLEGLVKLFRKSS